MNKLSVVLCLLLASLVAADLYLHTPPGSNNRNRERNDNRNNADRMFDSQNNGKGGYPWRGNRELRLKPDPLTYYVGSMLRVEYTSQHGCGDNPNVRANIMIQYTCDTENGNVENAVRDPSECGTKENNFLDGRRPCAVGLRDGYPNGPVQDDNPAEYKKATFQATDGQNAQGTADIPDPRNFNNNNPAFQDEFYYEASGSGVQFGMHESHKHYLRCHHTERNKGLYNADQKLNNNIGARATRQNPNGGRRGLECPEERDYYPYWNDALNPWIDVAMLTNNKEKCAYYNAHTPNRKAYGFCDGYTPPNNNANNKIPVDQAACAQKGGTWNPGYTNNRPFFCGMAMTSRDNHLGNAVRGAGSSENSNDPGDVEADYRQPETAHFMWKIPDEPGSLCVLRVRYNMSTLDYDSTQAFLDGGNSGVGADHELNCPKVNTNTDDENVLDQDVDQNVQCSNLITANSRPLFNRPYVQVFPNRDVSPAHKLSIALNTHQSSRTFQDRSYVFRIEDAPIRGVNILNMGVRGRRGNIVQCYPAVEYDFSPSVLRVSQGDVVHLQIHGSDFNAAKNANNGEGWQYSDRSNLVEMELSAHNFPLFVDQMKLLTPDAAQFWALMGQDAQNCEVYENGDNNEQNSITNCGKLNQAPARYPQDPGDGLMTVAQQPDTYVYVSTRNNNFSNRSHKGQMVIGGKSLSAAEIAGITVGVSASVFLVIGAVCLFGAMRPNTVAGQWYRSCAKRCPCCSKLCGRCAAKGGAPKSTSSSFRNSGKPKTVAPPDMEYTRH